LESLRALLIADPRVDSASCRVRLLRVDAQSFDVEVLCLVKTWTQAEFLAIQEDLLLQSLRIIDAEGSSLALPSSVVHLTGEKLAETSEEDAME
jgi:MscS family membrane protein